tara:strand:+ start:302 stop:544 length:243 start_codon:yes stop_codon:yes gene_type:complete
MALTKVEKDDYDIRTDYKHISVRTKVSIMEDGKEISYKYHRKVLSSDMDISKESAEVQALANALWTDEIKKLLEDSKKED